jgi:hypothetical protein
MSVWKRGLIGKAVLAAVLLAASPHGVRAQPSAARLDPSPLNTGALTFTGGLDVPGVYVFRGIVQETDPSLTVTPYGDLGVTLVNGDGGVRRLAVDVGLWNSLQTGSSGTKGPSARLHYAENFYSTLAVALAARMTLEATFTAYTSPNNMFNTIREASLRASHADRIRPYALVAFELSDNGQADNGAKKGTYGEFGVAPSIALGSRLRLAVPARVGASLKNYYELAGRDRSFGFAEIGGLVTMRLSAPARFGSWNVHGGADLYSFGETTRAYNRGNRTKVVGSVGIGVTY